MDKEIIELLKTLAGSTETLVIWYMIINFLIQIIHSITWVACFYMFVRGLRSFITSITES